MTLATVSLDDKYALDQGRVYMTGIKALVRLPLMQQAQDRASGLSTGGFISGCRGSPLGGCDAALHGTRAFLEQRTARVRRPAAVVRPGSRQPPHRRSACCRPRAERVPSAW